MKRSLWLAITLAAATLIGSAAGPAAAGSAGSAEQAISAPSPCPGTSPDVKLGTATPVLLVHGFDEGSSIFTTGSPSLVSALGTALGSSVQTAVFDYQPASLLWVTTPAIGPSLAGCIIWLAQRSDAQGGPGKVVIVAHSMGGLAVRCALGTACVQGVKGQPAADPNLVGLVVTLGTPNTGSNPQHFPPGIEQAVNAWCSKQPRCNEMLLARTTPAAKAMIAGSHELATLPWLPAGVPVVALAGDITFTANLLGTEHVVDAGDVAVPVDSAQAIAYDGTGTLRPGAQAPKPIFCGSVPLHELYTWANNSLALHAPAAPVTCWHETETTDSAWQSAIISAIRPVAQALSLRACTGSAISTALAVKDPTNATQRTLVTFACQNGWALAEVHQPLTLSDGSVVQDTGLAVLHQAATKWISEGLGDGTCIVNPAMCPGVPLPPSAVLQSLLKKTGLKTPATQAELYVNTVFTPGALYKYPTGPASIGLDNHNYIAKLQWAQGNQGDLIGTGTLHWDDCTPSCAGGTYHTAQLQITASNPQQCAAQVYPQGLGNPSQTVQATVFATIDVLTTQGTMPSFMDGEIGQAFTCAHTGG